MSRTLWSSDRGTPQQVATSSAELRDTGWDAVDFEAGPTAPAQLGAAEAHVLNLYTVQFREAWQLLCAAREDGDDQED